MVMRKTSANYAAATWSPSAGLSPEAIQSLVRPYLEQMVPIGTVVMPGDPPEPGEGGGDDLLVLAAEHMMSFEGDFPFRAVAALFPHWITASDPQDWRLRRTMFDRGFVCIASVRTDNLKALCFLASDSVRSLTNQNTESRGLVAMSLFRDGAGFANRMFRYACGKLYALRHGLTAAFPPWEGNALFGLEDPPVDGLALEMKHFPGFADNDRMFWDMDEPPIDIDLNGYFQELPECWRSHRPLLRRMFQLTGEQRQAMDGWHDQITEGGERTLVAIHVRRGDYCRLQHIPQFRLVPEEWYLNWLRALWPTLHRPILFVGTDEPEAVMPFFQDFETVSTAFCPADCGLPLHVRDMEFLRQAQYLAIANSSFSRMASILADDSQKCVLASFQTQSFEPYQPWIDPAFWARFRDTSYSRGNRIIPAPAVASSRRLAEAADTPEIHMDATDLVRYMLHHSTFSGIQRVQCEILRNLLETASRPIRVVAWNERGEVGTLDSYLLFKTIDAFRSGAKGKLEIESEVQSLLLRAVPCTIPPGHTFVTLGAFWGLAGTAKLLYRLKKAGAIVGVLIHDIIPMVEPQFFEAPATKLFSKALIEALGFCDFLLTTSEYNKSTIAKHFTSRNMGPWPIHIVPLAHAFPPAQVRPEVAPAVAKVLDTNYVLCVGTIEVRKNPAYLFHVWKMLIDSGRPDVPFLVFAGRKGWFVQDFFDQLQACNYMDGRVIVLPNVSDSDLELLYQKCLLTMFPSFVEGWGLPVGESLAHGKICLCSANGGIPDVGAELADYIDAYNIRDGFERLRQYLDDPARRREREREIAEQLIPRTWQTVSEDFLKSTQGLARMRGGERIRPAASGAALILPAGDYVPIGHGDGTLPGEIVCNSGWDRPLGAGMRPVQADASIRFRSDVEAGTKINLLLRFAAYGRDFNIRVRSGSGAQTEGTIAAGTERIVLLSCEVEAERLVSAYVSPLDAPVQETDIHPPHFVLKGILYFDAKRIAAQALSKLKRPPQGGSRPTSPFALRPTVESVTSTTAAPASRIQIRDNGLNHTTRAESFGAFLQGSDCVWPMEFHSVRNPPIFADQSDSHAFYSGCGNPNDIPSVGQIKDSIRLIRRSDQFVSTSRFSEGSVFDRAGVSKAFGYLYGTPAEQAPWMSREGDAVGIDEKALEAAPYYEHSYLVPYNGNLHNYYHWMVEGMVCLDLLRQGLGNDSNSRILLPKSVDINALLPHRESLEALGFGRDKVVEAGEGLIRVKEAIWVDSDLIQQMPAVYVRDFQQRVAALYAPLRTPRNRRLLVARKGPTRTIHNLQQVEALLSRFGFETVYLEGMSIKEQILLFQSAEFIVGPHGAGLANFLFCHPGTKVIELSPVSELRPFFWLIADKLNLIYGLQFCPTAEHGNFQSSVIVDVHKLEALMRMVDAHW